MRMNETISGIGKTENLLTKLSEKDIQLLGSTLESIAVEDFNKAVQLILNAKKIIVIGFSSSFALADFLRLRLIRLGKRVHGISLTGEPPWQAAGIYESADLLIATAFLRAARETQTWIMQGR